MGFPILWLIGFECGWSLERKPLAGGGGIISNYAEGFVAAYAEKLMTGTCTRAELMAFCRDLMLSDLDWCILLVHVFREANCCADRLANEGIEQTGHLVLMETSPSRIQELMAH